jgi:hypothetical protein
MYRPAPGPLMLVLPTPLAPAEAARRIGFGLKRIPGRGGGEFQISNVGAET